MKLSQAMGIMANFRRGGHIAPACSMFSSGRAFIGAMRNSFSLSGRSMLSKRLPWFGVEGARESALAIRRCRTDGDQHWTRLTILVT